MTSKLLLSGGPKSVRPSPWPPGDFGDEAGVLEGDEANMGAGREMWAWVCMVREAGLSQGR